MNNDFRAAGFFNSATAAIPVYVPGEMLLIRAEAYARKDMLTEAKAELDKVLHKEDSDDVFGIGADDTGYSGPMTKEAILEAIYTNRCYEMMMSGMRLEDSRRFNRPGPNDANEERNRNFYPYPNSERNNNTNTPADPAI